jgi:AbrB family looped-hinge helix DNA binding protein
MLKVRIPYMTATLRRIVRPLSKGQITLPVAIRRALGIDETSLLEVALDNDRVVISKLADHAASVRLYSDEEIDEFLEEDKITPEIAQRVRRLMRDALV